VTIQQVSLSSIKSRHGVAEPRKFRRLTASMATRGWVGRPLLAVPSGDGFRALTGSHRIAAARAASLETVPVHVVDISAHVAGGDLRCLLCGSRDCPADVLRTANNDVNILGALIAMGDDEAKDLMRREIRG